MFYKKIDCMMKEISEKIVVYVCLCCGCVLSMNRERGRVRSKKKNGDDEGCGILCIVYI